MVIASSVNSVVVCGNSGLISFLKVIFGFELENFVHVCIFNKGIFFADYKYFKLHFKTIFQ